MLITQLTDLHVRPRGKPANRVVETALLQSLEVGQEAA